jgi:glycogen synthase
MLASIGKVLSPETAVPNRKLKIGISIWSFTPNTGGLQSHAQLLCKYLQKRGHDVTVITRSVTRVPKFADYLFFNESESVIWLDGVPVRPLCLSHRWSPVLWAILKMAARPACKITAARVYEIVAARPAREVFKGFDLIHHIGEAVPLNGFAAANAAKYWKIPFIVQPTCHPYHVGDSKLDLDLFSRADRLLAHTKYEADYFRKFSYQCPIDIVGNGIEDRTDGVAERCRSKTGVRGPFILYIGRKDEQKGYFLLIEAFKIVRRQRPDVNLICMGPAGSMAPSSRMGGLVDLEFCSEDDKHDALAACSCLCVPSVGESFGLVFMEAGRYGKPVIGRNVPVLRELWEKGEAGLLVGNPDEKSNSASLEPGQLAEALLNLLSDEGKCRQLGGNLRRISEQFTWPRVAEKFESSYYQTLNRLK